MLCNHPFFERVINIILEIKTPKTEMLSHSTDAPRFSVSSCSIWRRAKPSVPKPTQCQPFLGTLFLYFNKKVLSLTQLKVTGVCPQAIAMYSQKQNWSFSDTSAGLKHLHFHLATGNTHIYPYRHVCLCSTVL